MVCLCWLFLVLVAYLCVPGFGWRCWESSICNDPSSEGRTLDCVHYCASVMGQTEFPELGTLGLKVDDGHDNDLLLSVILDLLASKDELSDQDLRAHSNERRSYTMEHFRWGKPPGDKVAQAKLRAQSNRRRSYTMEHFRWGKPPARKRRPVKMLAFADSSEDSAPMLARRKPSKDEVKRDLSAEGHQNHQVKRALVSSKTRDPLGLQDSKAGAYRMSHFRWGGPSAAKRGDGFMKLWQQKLLVNMIRTIVVKDVQRIKGHTKGRGEGEEAVFE